MKSVPARQQGDAYQAQAFWLKACRLFQPHSKVKQVGYEIKDVPHFDDIAVYYSNSFPDAHGTLIQADYYQVKWHVDQSGCLSCRSLTDPQSRKSSTSLLQRLHRAVEATAQRQETARFTFVTPWSIDPQDDLGQLVSGRDQELRLDVLFGSSASSRMSRLRTDWSEHLNVDTENLKRILSRLRLCINADSLDHLSRELSHRLAAAGLEPIPVGSRVNPYVPLIFRLHAEGRTRFSKQDLQQVCKAESLWRGSAFNSEDHAIGIRSFRRFAEHLEDETECLLDLTAWFGGPNGRFIRAQEMWHTEVGSQIDRFITDSVIPLNRCTLHLAAHSSIAFAAGYALDPKAGTKVALIQNATTGRQVWEMKNGMTAIERNIWRHSKSDVNPEGSEVGVVLSVTHDILNDVRIYVQKQLPQISHLLVFTPVTETGPASVKDGSHARRLAEQVVGKIRERRQRQGPLHIFSAAPNGLMLFMGRLARSLGPIQLYEYDFESNAAGAYLPSLTLPLQTHSP